MENSNLGNFEESSGSGGSSSPTSTTPRRSSRTPKTRIPPVTFNESESDQYADDDEGNYLANKIQQSSNNKAQPSQQHIYNLLYDCRYCTTNFSSHKDRSIHEEKWHKSGPKPYKCKIRTCPHRFYFKEDCEIHEKHHHMYQQKPENNHHHKVGAVIINRQNSKQFQFQQIEFPTVKLNGNANTVNDSDSSRRIFSCELCPSRYTSKRKLKLHIKWRHTSRHQNPKLTSFKTEVYEDPASVPVPASLVSRKVKPSNLGTGTGTGTAAGNQESNRKYFSCSICKQSFTTHYSRQVHERVHSGDLRYSCRFCAKKFASGSRRNYHLKATACSTASCSKVQTETQQIDSNASCGRGHANDTIRNETGTKTSTSTRPVPVATALIQSPSANTSSRVNSSKIKRKRQELLSNMIQDYTCHVCGRQFTSKCSVTRHSRLHTGIKPYNCPYCPATFTRSDAVKYHVKIHSQVGRENYTHRCNICHASYQTHRALLVHWRVVHRQEELKDGHQK